jgi:hypothetical protein
MRSAPPFLSGQLLLPTSVQRCLGISGDSIPIADFAESQGSRNMAMPPASAQAQNTVNFLPAQVFGLRRQAFPVFFCKFQGLIFFGGTCVRVGLMIRPTSVTSTFTPA